jgi:hypothetical protein
MSNRPLHTIRRDLSNLAEDESRVSLGAVVRTLETRGFGPLLAVLAGFLLLPVGMLPGFPALIGLLLIATGGQMLRGKAGLWLPGPIARIDLPADRLQYSSDKAGPPVQRVRQLVAERMTFAVGVTATRAIAAMLLLFGLAMIGLGFVPGLPFLLALPVLLFGLGLTFRDGLLVCAGGLCTLPAVATGWAGV